MTKDTEYLLDQYKTKIGNRTGIEAIDKIKELLFDEVIPATQNEICDFIDSLEEQYKVDLDDWILYNTTSN